MMRLAMHLLARACADYGLPPKTLTPDAHAALLSYHWPGNVRELSNAMERVALLADAELITASMLGLPEGLREDPPAPAHTPMPLAEAIGSVERELLLRALEQTQWNISRALGIARRLGDLKLSIVTTTYLEQAQYYRGEFEQVVKLVTGNLAALPAAWVYESLGNQAPASVYDRYWLVRSLAQLGRLTEAVEYEAEVIRLAEPTHHPYTVALAHLAGSMLRLLKGDWEKARSLAEHSVAVQWRGNVRILLHTAIASSAWALAQLGEASEALALASPRGMRPLIAHCHLGLGTLYGKTGWREQAGTELAAAIALYRAMDMPFWLTRAEGTLAEVVAAKR